MSDPTPEAWLRVDAMIDDTLSLSDPLLQGVVAAQRRAGLPSIEVSPATGKLLQLLVRISGARRVLEIGTLGGYSTICMARALPPDGRIVTIEAEPLNADVAQANIDAAGVAAAVAIRRGRALDVLGELSAEEPFDLVFIDADKESNTRYLDHAARLGRPGTVIVVDNVVRAGDVADPAAEGAQIDGVRAGLRMLGDDARFDATALQTLDRKGWDGLAVAVLR